MDSGLEAESPKPFIPLGAYVYGLSRMVGFVILAGTAVAILAAVVLLPEYVRWTEDRYKRDLEAAKTADLEAQVEANGKMLLAAADDPILVRRLAMSLLNLVPANETIIPIKKSEAEPMPGTAKTSPAPRPVRIQDSYTQAASRIQDDGIRRGLVLLATGLLLAAAFLFASPSKYASGAGRGKGNTEEV